MKKFSITASRDLFENPKGKIKKHKPFDLIKNAK
jgi:hypothetical protein